jgi:zinc transport system substrate-binding protein
MIRRIVFFLTAFLLVSSAATASPLRIFVSIAPQKYIVERLAGGNATVHMLVEQGQDPHFFEPSPRQLLLLDSAQLYFTVGLEFERQLTARLTSLHQKLKIVALDAGIAKLPMTEHLPQESGAGEDAVHHEEEGDPHIWMSPLLVRKMAATAASALVAMDPEHRQDYEKNLTLFQRDLDTVHRQIAALLAPFRGRVFYVFHPAFAYFADTYGLVQKAVEAGGRTPSARQLAALIKEAKEEKVRIIFVQPQFDERSGAAIAAAISGTVIRLDSLAYDLIGNFNSIAKALVEAFGR